MIVHQPTRLAVLSVVVTALNAALAAALGSLALAAALVVLLVGLLLSYREAKARPLAQVTAGVLRLQSRSLSAGIDVAAIQGWQRSGKLLAIQSSDGGDVVVGPYWTEAPARELEQALGEAFPDKR